MNVDRRAPAMNEKIFSFNDLIDMGLITQKQIEDRLRYIEAEKTVNELFKGMF